MNIVNRDLYSSALTHLGADADANEYNDYEDRVPYIIANFCSAHKALDSKIRKAEGLEAASSFSPVYLFLESNFPLCEKLASPAVFYLAAMLVIDDDPELSDKLYERYCDLITEATMSLSYQSEKIENKYFAT
jgi:hypothetical protein